MNAERTVYRDAYIRVEGDLIKEIIPAGALRPDADEEIIDASSLTLLPGFIQTHIHLCQTLFRGMADDLELLDWLQLRIFPYENAHNKDSLRASVRLGINELIKGGTTTILDMGTLRHQETIFEELISSGIRAFAGKCMMDMNGLFPSFKNDTRSELAETERLVKEFHFKNSRVGYGFAPRFALSCTYDLLKQTAEMHKDNHGTIMHTHASENRGEIEEVRKIYGKENIDFLHSSGLLGESSVLAHCIHLNEDEVRTLKSTGTAVSHCPSSNLKLGSGIANIPHYLKSGIKVSLGADGAPCNNNLSALTEARLAALLQKPFHGPTAMDAYTVLKLATIDGARALGIDKITGSIEPGKKADFILMDTSNYNKGLDESDSGIFSNIIYAATDGDVHSTFIDGNCVYRKGVKEIYDTGKLIADARTEKEKLLNRV